MIITQDEERIGQFSTRARAARYARMETARTGRAHRYILTTCYRDLEFRCCWYVYLDAGVKDAQYRAYGSTAHERWHNPAPEI